MGQGQSAPRVSKVVKEERKKVATQVLDGRKSEINAFQERVASTYQDDPENAKRAIMAGECAKKQLERGGKPFDKTDLITILLYINPKQIENIAHLKTLVIEDLNALIRAIIYDVNYHQQSVLTIQNGHVSQAQTQLSLIHI